MDLTTKLITTTTLHDPEGKLIPIIHEYYPKVKELLGDIIVVCTNTTLEKVLTVLKTYKVRVFVCPKKGNLHTYRMAYSEALKITKVDQKIFQLDFDRLLHWMLKYPDELKTILTQNLDVDYLHIGRTQRAYQTHPRTQVVNEIIPNQFATKILHLPQYFDAVSIVWIITPFLAKILLKLDKINTTITGFYASWPVVLWNTAKTKRYIEVEGQEWETADRYREEIANSGYQTWIESFQTAKEWERRALLTQEALEELYRICEIKYNFNPNP